MNIKYLALTLILAGLMSNFVKSRNPKYASFGPLWFSWIRSVVSSATAVFGASFVAFPSRTNETPAPILYTYYTLMTLLVTALAVKLIWVPLLEFGSEMNLILSKTILYVSKNVHMCPKSLNLWMARASKFFGTKAAIACSTHIIGLVFLYSASSDILNFMSIYIRNLPNWRIFSKMRKTALRYIDGISNFLGPKKQNKRHWNSEVCCFHDTR